MKTIRTALIFLVIVLSYDAGICQKKFSATLHLPSRLDLGSVSIYFDDGEGQKRAPVNGYIVELSGTLYAKYVNVQIYYPDSSKPNGRFIDNFWLNETPAEIYITPEAGQKDPLKKMVLKNAYDAKYMGQDKYDSIVKNEWMAFEEFARQQTGHPANDSTMGIASVLLSRLYTKDLQFIRDNPRLYLSFWLFRSLTTSSIDTDTLLSVFNTLFPDSLKKSPEGQVILKALLARINAQEGMQAPDYTSVTNDGKTISPSANTGKFVLLDFWASWCGPCIKETPRLKSLQKKYGGNKFQLISVTLDNDRKDFEAAVKKNKMDWTHIFGNSDLVKAYSVGAIPELFLIDPTGKIIYTCGTIDRNGGRTEDPGLKRLYSILQKNLDEH
jgi:thiol-disulfide isomerase/thioredoxin